MLVGGGVSYPRSYEPHTHAGRGGVSYLHSWGDEPHTHVHRGRSLLSRLIGGASFLGSGGISLGAKLSVIILVYTTANQSE